MKHAVRSEAFFFGAGRGARFCLLHEPAHGAPCGAVLYLPPFAEEQNRVRRGAANAARALAHAGWVVLQMDLAGCGDSAGDFADATWSGWLDDLRHGLSILSKRSSGPLWLWSVRAGSLLASELVKQSLVGQNSHVLLWQPVLSGAQHIKQFLRLRMARDTVAPALGGRAAEGVAPDVRPKPLAHAGAAAGQLHTVLDIVSCEHAARRSRGTTHQLRADWICGRAVEVAGYTVSPALAFALDRAVFELPAGFKGRVVWLECQRANQEQIPPAGRLCLDALLAQGLNVELRMINEAPFWQTTEIVECPSLVAASVSALGGAA